MNNLNKYLDYTLLKQDATTKDITKLCKEAVENEVYAVCVNSCYVAHAKKELENTSIKVCSVVGFPLGMMDSESKAYETENAIGNGANEIDMVINVGKLKEGAYEYVEKDIKSVLAVCRKNNVTLKVIIETCLLTDKEKEKACNIIKKVGADFVKTSTGFSTGGATIEDVLLMKRVVGKNVKIKASGGIRDRKTAFEFIEKGVDRIGASKLF